MSDPIAPSKMLEMDDVVLWQKQREFQQRTEKEVNERENKYRQKQQQQHRQQQQQQQMQQQMQQQNSKRRPTFGEQLVEDKSDDGGDKVDEWIDGDDIENDGGDNIENDDDDIESEGSAIGDFIPPHKLAAHELLGTLDKTPLIQQMGFRSYSIREDRIEYNRRRKIASEALSEKPLQFIVGAPWRSVKSKTTRQKLIDKVKAALAQYNYSDSVIIGIIMSLTNNKRRNKNREKNRKTNESGGTVKRGRPPTHGYFSGKRKKAVSNQSETATVNPVQINANRQSSTVANHKQPSTTNQVNKQTKINPTVVPSVAPIRKKAGPLTKKIHIHTENAPANEVSYTMQPAVPVQEDSEQQAAPVQNIPRKKPMNQSRVPFVDGDQTTEPQLPSPFNETRNKAMNQNKLPRLLPLTPHKPHEMYSVLINGEQVQYSLSLKYEDFRRKWNNKDTWYRFPGGNGQILMDDEGRYMAFLSKVKQTKEIPAMWIHTEKEYQSGDDDSYYTAPPPPQKTAQKANDARSKTTTAPKKVANAIEKAPAEKTPAEVAPAKKTGTGKASANNNSVNNLPINDPPAADEDNLMGTQKAKKRQSARIADKIAPTQKQADPKPPGKRRGRPPGKKTAVAANGKAPPGGTQKEKAPRKAPAKTKKKDEIQEQIDRMSNVIQWDNEKPVEKTVHGYIPQISDSSQYYPPSCGQPLLAPQQLTRQQLAPQPLMAPQQLAPQQLARQQLAGTQHDSFNPTPPCAQPEPQTQVLTQPPREIVPSYPTQFSSQPSYSQAHTRRPISTMPGLTQDYIREDGFDIGQLTGLEDVFVNQLNGLEKVLGKQNNTTPPRSMGPPQMATMMDSSRKRKPTGRMTPSRLLSSERPGMAWNVPNVQVPGSEEVTSINRFAKTGRRGPPHIGLDNNMAPMGHMIGEAPLAGPQDNQRIDYRKALGHQGEIGNPNQPGTGFRRTLSIVREALTGKDNESDTFVTPAKRDMSGGLSNAQKRLKLAAQNHHAKKNGIMVPETPING